MGDDGDAPLPSFDWLCHGRIHEKDRERTHAEEVVLRAAVAWHRAEPRCEENLEAATQDLLRENPAWGEEGQG